LSIEKIVSRKSANAAYIDEHTRISGIPHIGETTIMLIKSLKQLKRIIVAVIGFTVLAIGIVLIVLPGPAFIVIPAGLAILAAEFAWARILLLRIKDRLQMMPGGLFRRNNKNIEQSNQDSNRNKWTP
jgi:hypothetical protein